jgi:tRNA 2-thiocytidine biosynthesis protein TtcA
VFHACGGERSTALPASRGFTKIALGHHRDDIMETLFMNMFHGGRMAAMPAKLLQ